MKNFYLVSIISLAIGFTACSDDDDSSSSDDSSTSDCFVCSFDVADAPDIEYCQDEDGVVTANGVEVDLQGFDYDTWAAGIKASGTCE